MKLIDELIEGITELLIDHARHGRLDIEDVDNILLRVRANLTIPTDPNSSRSLTGGGGVGEGDDLPTCNHFPFNN